MTAPLKHMVHQTRTIAALGHVAWTGLQQQLGWRRCDVTPSVPGPEHSATTPSPPRDLVRDFIRNVGGDPGAYRGVVPPHLFPQWIFPVAEKTLTEVPYPLIKMVNGGCRMEVKGELPLGAPLRVVARLEEIDDNGRRAVLRQRVSTGTDSVPDLVVVDVYEVVPLKGEGKGQGKGKGKGQGKGQGKGRGHGEGKGSEKQRPRVPAEARELAYWKIPADAGLAFAALTGDLNPLHWLRPYARAAGFKGTILHGFATMARAIEGLNRAYFAGNPRRLASFDARFTKPLVLPARVGLYVADHEVFVGEAPGGTAYLAGSFTTRPLTKPILIGSREERGQ